MRSFLYHYSYFQVESCYISFFSQFVEDLERGKEKTPKLRFYNENTLCLTVLVFIHCFNTVVLKLSLAGSHLRIM